MEVAEVAARELATSVLQIEGSSLQLSLPADRLLADSLAVMAEPFAGGDTYGDATVAAGTAVPATRCA